ncbi:hypothetical protein V9T40_006588 [Parthenolecanium corni]|uniref:Cytidine deaminase n=1 Tax=Parthenolecanium corni TaxID=536013 RepID=A0AAN9Y7J8_9HEMI
MTSRHEICRYSEQSLEASRKLKAKSQKPLIFEEKTDEKVRALIEESVAAREQAYAPYSKFAVGAALRSTSGQLFSGCNVENASYSMATCAERTAVVKAVSQGCRHFESVAVSAVLPDKFVSPCGSCRQILSEFGDANLVVYLVRPDTRQVLTTTIGALLPLSFKF